MSFVLGPRDSCGALKTFVFHIPVHNTNTLKGASAVIDIRDSHITVVPVLAAILVGIIVIGARRCCRRSCGTTSVGGGWFAGSSLGVEVCMVVVDVCQATLPELPMRTRDSLSPTSPTSYCR